MRASPARDNHRGRLNSAVKTRLSRARLSVAAEMGTGLDQRLGRHARAAASERTDDDRRGVVHRAESSRAAPEVPARSRCLPIPERSSRRTPRATGPSRAPRRSAASRPDRSIIFVSTRTRSSKPFSRRATAGQQDAALRDVGGQLGRRALERLLDRPDDHAHRLLERAADLLAGERDRLRQARHEVASLHLGGQVVVERPGRADLELQRAPPSAARS